MHLRDDPLSLPALPAREGEVPFPPPPRGDPPTAHLTSKELAELRQTLENHRKKLAAEIARLQNEACCLGAISERGGVSERVAQGIAVAAAVWERALRLSAIAHKRSILHQIDRALGRIENNTYGRCAETNKAIPLARLREIPWARAV